ncbi:MAG: cytochrome P450 [Chloroflexi bacterium]|nr:cytochrome P450 [Chloroflexota bacterium]MDA1147214.1 cytochrome P450 [Chloroflexota bacterium]
MPADGESPIGSTPSDGHGELDPFDSTVDEVWSDPDGHMRQLRMQDPVHWSDLEQSWVLTRHADAQVVLRDDRTFATDGRNASGLAGEQVRAAADHSPLPYDTLLSSANREDHARLRRALAGAFTPTSVEAMRAPTRGFARELLAAVSGDELDVITSYTRPLALAVTLQLMGVEVADMAEVSHLANRLMAAAQHGESSQSAEELATQRDEFDSLIDGLQVGDGSLIASLRADRANGRISNDELTATLVFVATVGQAPTAFAIGNAILALMRNTDQFEALRAEPALLSHVIDESVRFQPPLRVLRRFAGQDTALGGRPIRAGDQLQIVVPAANRDPAVFDDPHRFDLQRNDRTHLSFGWGSHHCLGAPVARLVAEESIGLLLDKFPELIPSGRLELLTGEATGPTRLGIVGRGSAEPTRRRAAAPADVAHRSVPPAALSHACPCGSGRRYEVCHAMR